MTNIHSDLNVVSSVTATGTICANSPATITLTPSLVKWNTLSSLSGGTDNGDTQGKSRLTAGASSPNYNINWLTQAQSDALYNYIDPDTTWFRRFEWLSVDRWTPFLSSQGISHSDNPVGVHYSCPEPNQANYYGQGGDEFCDPPLGAGSPPTNYRALSDLFCNANANLQITGQPTTSVPFAGSTITRTTNPLPQGTYTVTGSVDVARCMASIKTQGNFGPSQDVWIATQDSFKPSFSAGTATISVLPHYDCANSLSLTPGTPTPNPVPPNTVVTMPFSITNNGDSTITVPKTSITATITPSSTGFSNLQIPVPAGSSITVNAHSTVQATATISVATPAPNTYAIKLNLPFTTTDCDQTTKNCPKEVSFNLNVQGGGGGITCDPLVLSPPGPFFVNGQATAAATCKLSGTPTPCPMLTWTTTNGIGSMNPPQHISSSTFTATTAGTGRIKADNDAQNVHCITPADVTVYNIPDACSVDYSPHGGNFCSVSDSAPVKAACTKGGVATLCPEFSWVTDAAGPGVSMVPPTTLRSLNPQSTLTIAGAQVQPNKKATATSTEPGVPLSCFKNFNIVSCNPAASCTLSVVPDIIAPGGAPATAAADCLDAGSGETACPKLDWTATFTPSGSGTFNPTPTEIMVHPTTEFRVSAGTPIGATGTVNAMQQGGGLVCLAAAFTVGSGGGLKTISCTPDKTLYNSPDTGKITVACSGGSPPDCPELQWTSTLIQGLTTPTPAQRSPFDNPFTIPAGVSGTGRVTATCIQPSLCANSPACRADINIGPGGTLPDYTAKVVPHKSQYFVNGEPAIVDITTRNIGGSRGGPSTTLVAGSSRCVPSSQPLSIGPLNENGGFDLQLYSCSCSSPGIITVSADADYPTPGAVVESNENNNHASSSFLCCPAEGCHVFACFDYF